MGSCYQIIFQVYESLYRAMITTPGAMERPKWWKEVLDRPVRGSKNDELKSKL